MRVVQQGRKREPVTRTIAAAGWAVCYRRAADNWEASCGTQREYFATEEESIALTHESYVQDYELEVLIPICPQLGSLSVVHWLAGALDRRVD